MTTTVITRNAPDRYRGFLASVMLEVTPGIYVSPHLSRSVRDRIIDVCREWSEFLPNDGAVTLIWRDKASPGGLAIEVIGNACSELVSHDGLWLERIPLSDSHRKHLLKVTGLATGL